MWIKALFIFTAVILTGCGPSGSSHRVKINIGIPVKKWEPVDLSRSLSYMLTGATNPYCVQDRIQLVLWNETTQSPVSFQPVKLHTNIASNNPSSLPFPNYSNSNAGASETSIGNTVAWMAQYSSLETPLEVDIPDTKNHYVVGLFGHFYHPIDNFNNALNSATPDGLCDQRISASQATLGSSLSVKTDITPEEVKSGTLNLNIKVLHLNPGSSNYNFPGSIGVTGATVNNPGDWLEISPSFNSGLFRLKKISYLNNLINVDLDNTLTNDSINYNIPDAIGNTPAVFTFTDSFSNSYTTPVTRSSVYFNNSNCSTGCEQTPFISPIARAGTFAVGNSDVDGSISLSGASGSPSFSTGFVTINSASGGTCSGTITGLTGSFSSTGTATVLIKKSSPPYFTGSGIFSIGAGVLNPTGTFTGTCPVAKPILASPAGITFSPGTATGGMTYTTFSVSVINIFEKSGSVCTGKALVSGAGLTGTGSIPLTISAPAAMSAGVINVAVTSATITSSDYSGPCPTPLAPFEIKSFH